MMQTTMLVQTMMQAMGNGDVHDITSFTNDESHKEKPCACSNIACESPLVHGI
jgi:hypothetical protein